jgi:glycosyltransferase involved in cell wall biosynthesis
MNDAAVSVVVPAYNAAQDLGAAIDTILAQSYPPHEIIIVDDGSTDATSRVIAGFGGRLIALRQDNGGPSAARNAGIARATAPFIAFLDADDRWLPDTLALQLACLDAAPAAGAAWGKSERQLGCDPLPAPAQWELFMGSKLFRRVALEAADGFDPGLRRGGEDLDLLVRLAERGIEIIRHPALVHIFRLHGGNHFSLDLAALQQANLQVASKAMARRRVRGLEAAS